MELKQDPVDETISEAGSDEEEVGVMCDMYAGERI